MSQPKCPNCKNDIWRIKELEEKAYCENCNTARNWFPRKRKATQITPSQQDAIERVRRLFTGEWRDKEPRATLKQFEYNLDAKNGIVWLKVETDEHQGGHFMIGRRGKAECVRAYDFGRHDEAAKHYNYMVRKK